MTVSKPNNSNQIKTSVQIQEIGNMSLHINNLLKGRVIVGEWVFYIICKTDNYLLL